MSEQTGDVPGVVTFFYAWNHFFADGHMVAMGPFEGTVTWDGRTGDIRGMFTTNCMPVDGVPSCDGIWVARGSGELKGVKFQVRWGTGLWPFDYEGYALDSHA